MCILISARGQYIVIREDGTALLPFDLLRDAVASVRYHGKEPIFMWDME